MFAASTLYHWWLRVRETASAYLRSYRYLYHDCCFVYSYMYWGSWRCAWVDGIRTALGYGYRWGFYKITAINKYPRLSLIIYLVMGWSVVFIAEPVYSELSITPLLFILAEGLFYTSGTYFFSHDSRPYYHGIWHIFVLLGAICHWSTVLCILCKYCTDIILKAECYFFATFGL